jgi:hypothetical protein
MGVHSMISHAISQMREKNTTNKRTLGKWVKRVTGIAQDLEKSPDIAKSVSVIVLYLPIDQLFYPRQRKLEAVVADVAARFTSTETNQEESTSQIAPKIYRKRKEILTDGDKTLDAIQVKAVPRH